VNQLILVYCKRTFIKLEVNLFYSFYKYFSKSLLKQKLSNPVTEPSDMKITSG